MCLLIRRHNGYRKMAHLNIWERWPFYNLHAKFRVCALNRYEKKRPFNENSRRRPFQLSSVAMRTRLYTKRRTVGDYGTGDAVRDNNSSSRFRKLLKAFLFYYYLGPHVYKYRRLKTMGATYFRLGGHHVGHRPTF